MHVKAKQIAFAGLLAAFSAVLMFLSTAIESSSLFFIAAASFCVGIVIREMGVVFGASFWLASTLVNFMVAPNKFYCITFAAMGLYLVLSETVWEKIAQSESMNHRAMKFWIGKIVIFNVMYLPVLFAFPELIFAKKVTGGWLVLGWIAGQAVLFVYDYAYRYFQGRLWGRIRNRFL